MTLSEPARKAVELAFRAGYALGHVIEHGFVILKRPDIAIHPAARQHVAEMLHQYRDELRLLLAQQPPGVH